MRKFTVAVAVTAAAVVVLALFSGRSDAGAFVVDPCLQSVLCSGLQEHFKFEEASNETRFGAFRSALLERGATNIGNAAGVSGIGGNAVDLLGDGNSWLWRSFAPAPAGFFTIGFWFRADTLPASGSRASFISWNHGNINRQGPSVWLYNNAGTTKVCLHLVNIQQSSGVEHCNTTAISTATWYYVAAGVDDGDDTPGGRRAFISINGAAKETTALSFFVQSGFPQLRIGQRPVGGPSNQQGSGDYNYDGRIDELSIWARSVPDYQISLLYNSGSGRAYPFVTGE